MRGAKRAGLYYLFAFLAMTFFGRQVCSVFATLPAGEVFVLLGCSYLAAFLIRCFLESRVVLSRPMLEQARAQLVFDFLLMLLPGVIVMIYDSITHAFPLGSGLKVSIGAATLGFYFSVDLALRRERMILEHVQRRNAELRPGRIGLSLTARFATLGAFAVLLPAADIMLLVLRHLEGLGIENSVLDLSHFGRVVLTELAFVLLILSALILNLIITFAGNLRLFFEAETEALQRVTEGDLDARVPVFSSDEFGRISDLTNRMIIGLRERKLIREVLGKVVSSEGAKLLLERAKSGAGLGGEKRNLTVLFADLREFTSYAESREPEEVLQELNRILGKMVDQIHKHRGIVDKFSGDGIMAVFGFDNPEGGPAQAVRAALELPKAAHPRRVAVGIHCGEVIAGLIGARERQEFTFIGDVVNTASRLEALAKEEDVEVVASSDVIENVRDPDLISRFLDQGDRLLKGKKKKLKIYTFLNPSGDQLG